MFLDVCVVLVILFVIPDCVALFSFIFQGKKNSIFREYYVGHQRHCKVIRLCPAVGYTFRVAALNDIGTRFVYLSVSYKNRLKKSLIK